MKSSTLVHLLHLTWSSPVFGNAYPKHVSIHTASSLKQVETLYSHLMNSLEPILAQGMPMASSEEVDEIILQIAPKCTAFCPAIAAGEIDDVERLSAAAVSLALICWADQSMDRGDDAMLAAVKMLNKGVQDRPIMGLRALTAEVHARLNGLRWIEHSVESLSRPEDTAILLQCVYEDTLQNEARMRDLSRQFALQVLRRNGADFWQMHAEEVARLSIVDVALIYVTATIYAVYRYHHPDLPRLYEVFNEPAIMDVMRGPCNAMIRVFDDFGDRQIDDGYHPAWGEFNLNIFNQPHPQLVEAFLKAAGIQDERVFKSVQTAFRTGSRISWAYIIQVFADLVRDRLSNLPAPLWERFEVFLTLARRMIETGYVNMLGDIELAESQAPATHITEGVTTRPSGRLAQERNT